MTEIAICIATRQRPQGITRTLRSLGALVTEREVTVIVADNDAVKREGIAAAEALQAEGYRWPLKLLTVATPGIPQVRNALVEAALRLPDIRFVAMLDDDEAADPHWLHAMLACQAATRADVVGGAVLREMEGEVAPWAARHPLLQPKSRGASGVVDLIDSTANVLIDAEALRALGDKPFDEAMALTGGSDKQLFTRMQRAGRRFAWAEDARVTELIPASRITSKWLLMRGYRIGMTDTITAMTHSTPFKVATVEAPRILGGFVLGSLGVLTLDRAKRIVRLGKLYRAAGKIAALTGHRYEEYRKVHGA
ncbi:glycosyltransferase family 2 protein [Sphingomonas psychrotolerans]|uniref:Glycosyltransferase family 2 protein n=1 Tax=Sphingomonas psychrotolerans TaxID=1327635 RepID=A0ABU3N7P7_9SPHN|nr:glycosyltransferase [Sphingomonas psychrotolerans]MDT8759812.1 glycosyltransferase family 2 protein [Sphingomonas psychrotolerans]